MTGDQIPTSEGDTSARAPFLLILDRDGTVIQDKGYLCDPDQIVLESDAVEGLRALIALGAVPVIVTNQSGVARGFFSRADVEAAHVRLSSILAEQNIAIAGFYVCPHQPGDRCECRKPGTLLGVQAAAEHALPFETAIVVGDKLSDVELGLRLGGLGVLVRTGEGAQHEPTARQRGYRVVDSLLELSKILEQERN